MRIYIYIYITLYIYISHEYFHLRFYRNKISRLFFPRAKECIFIIADLFGNANILRVKFQFTSHSRRISTRS